MRELVRCATGKDMLIGKAYLDLSSDHQDIVADVSDWLLQETPEPEIGIELLVTLIDELTDYAPTYGHFSAHPSNDKCFGFWPPSNISQVAYDNDIPIVNDPCELENLSDDVLEAFFVNCHGNTTLYFCSPRGWHQDWAIV